MYRWVPGVSSSGSTNLCHSVRIPSVPDALRFLMFSRVSSSSGQKIVSSFSGSGSSCHSLGLDSFQIRPHAALYNGLSRLHSLRHFLSPTFLSSGLVGSPRTVLVGQASYGCRANSHLRWCSRGEICPERRFCGFYPFACLLW
jgi:hypothetical protein